MNFMENLLFDKEGYFHVLVFYGLFYKRNIETLHVKVCETLVLQAHVSTAIYRFREVPLVFL